MSASTMGPQVSAPLPSSMEQPSEEGDLRSLIHQLNNQLGIVLAHAELLEAKATEDRQRARATEVVTAALQAMGLAREIRSTIADLK